MGFTGKGEVALINGYLRSDSRPRIAKLANLGSRVAVSTTSEDGIDAELDRGLYRDILRVALAVLEGDSIRIERNRKSEAISVANIDANQVCDWIEGNDEPASAIEFLDKGIVGGVLVTEFWVNVGGPDPYHDSYTFALYSSANECAAFAFKLRELCGILGRPVREYQGQSGPPRFRATVWLKRIIGL